jgi:hypothetical protein
MPLPPAPGAAVEAAEALIGCLRCGGDTRQKQTTIKHTQEETAAWWMASKCFKETMQTLLRLGALNCRGEMYQ